MRTFCFLFLLVVPLSCLQLHLATTSSILYTDNLAQSNQNYYFGSIPVLTYYDSVFRYMSNNPTAQNCPPSIPYANYSDANLSCFHCTPIYQGINVTTAKVLFDVQTRQCQVCTAGKTSICDQMLAGTYKYPPAPQPANASANASLSTNASASAGNSSIGMNGGVNSSVSANSTVNGSNVSNSSLPVTRVTPINVTNSSNATNSGVLANTTNATVTNLSSSATVSNLTVNIIAKNSTNITNGTTYVTPLNHTANLTVNSSANLSSNSSANLSAITSNLSANNTVANVSVNATVNSTNTTAKAANASSAFNSAVQNVSIGPNVTKLNTKVIAAVNNGCPSATPLYDATTGICVACPTGQQFINSQQACLPIIYATNPQAPNLIMTNLSQLSLVNAQLQAAHPQQSIQYCPLSAPFSQNGNCIHCGAGHYFYLATNLCIYNCPYGYSYDPAAYKCTKTQFYSNINAPYLVSQTGSYSSWVAKVNYRASSSPLMSQCPLSTPYQVGGKCISCPNGQLFNMDTSTCEYCSNGRYYDGSTRKCVAFVNNAPSFATYAAAIL